MSGSPFGKWAIPGQSRASRRAIVTMGIRLAGGSALAALPVAGMLREAAAQDDSVILVAGAAEIGASPGSAYARSAVAEAAAARGAARVQAAAALAEANSDDGAITQSPVAFAAADPDEGAVAQSAVAVASASSQPDAGDGPSGYKAPAKIVTPAGRGGGGRGGGRRARAGRGRGGAGGRTVRVGRGAGRDRRGRGGVGKLPSAGIGSLENGALASVFASASAAAGLGAVLLRRQANPDVAAQPVVADD